MRSCLGAFLGVCFLGLLAVGGCVVLVGMTSSAIRQSEQKEQERLANMTPEERAAEEQQVADRAAAAESARAAAKAAELTMAKYSAIQTGMSEADVVRIIGRAGEEQSSNRLGQGTQFDVSTKLVAWTEILKSITVTFQNGKVVQKAQFGL